ncbi:DNA-binding transcriptional regulator GbsR, MarR family [Pelagirhabdus alkalitolerans]|uniref:HTH-type transcriptional regulator n=1 Tax=Pelagirhabdus alkalitolerans TaxID=1612202 RepID=A0A1G6N8M0_9BACI|nr:MarR family transcriptional regulator [Pelagirhabdus alkalitolerans]SDC64188.1 DNA-binding transcriptional regulator GbsR, MarR family [Pelagirhabdus alkalitolerans]
MNHEERLEQIKHRVSEQIAENMKSYGFPGTIGRVIAAIFYEGRALDLDELAEHTGMSKTRMSQVLREMVHYDIAEKAFVRGSRKDHYTVEEDYYQTFISLFTSNWRDVVVRNRKIESRIMQELESIMNDPEATPEVIEKAKMYKDDSLASVAYYDWIDRVVELFESQKIFDIVPKKEIEEIKKDL